jgi:PhnB protein
MTDDSGGCTASTPLNERWWAVSGNPRSLNSSMEDQMPQINAYLAFDGNCADAMRFYEQVLQGSLKALLKNSETPAAPHVPKGNEDRIMHAYLEFDGGSLMAGDTMAGEKYYGIRGVAITLSYENTDEAKRVFDALSEGGNVSMPWSPTFWAEAFGMVKDRFGTPWIINGKSLMPQP